MLMEVFFRFGWSFDSTLTFLCNPISMSFIFNFSLAQKVVKGLLLYIQSTELSFR